MSIILMLRARLHHFLRGLFSRDRLDKELSREIEGHFDMLVAQKVAEGMSPAEARRAARLEFGGIDQVSEQVRDVRFSAWVDNTRRELRRCLRSLARTPLFTVAAVVTVAGGVGSSVAIFTVVNAVLLRPLPFPDSDELVLLDHVAPGPGLLNDLPMSDALYFLYADESRTLDRVAGFRNEQVSFTGPENPQRVQAVSVTASFFDVLQMTPRLGRAFTVEDDRPGAALVIVLGDGLWRSRFGADPGIVGRIVEVDGERVEVIGVMPPGIAFARPPPEFWRPIRLDREHARLGYFGLNGVARIAEGSTLEQVQAELGAMLSNLPEIFPDQPAAPILANEFRPLIRRARAWVVGDIEATLWILTGAVGVLLLIACANVANLFLTRSAARQNEVALRASLGATRMRLAKSVLLESLVVGVTGGLVALPLAMLAVRLLVRMGPQNLPRLDEIGTDTSVLLFGLAMSVVAGLLAGCLPALRAAAVATTSPMAAGSRSGAGGRRRPLVRRSLVVVQIMLALTLLIGSGLTVRSYQRLVSIDPGFDPVDVLTFGLALPPRDYDTPGARLAFYRQVIERLHALPHAVDAAAASYIPLRGVVNQGSFSIEGRPYAEGDVSPAFQVNAVSPGYFDAMRIGLVEGRVFDLLDEERNVPIIMVSRSVAQAYWPGESALGKGIRLGNPPEGEGQYWSRIVGVVDDVREIALNEAPPEMAYFPVTGISAVGDVPWQLHYVVRAPNAAALAGPVREMVGGLDPALPVFDVETLETLVGQGRETQAFVTVLLIAAAALALLLGAVGLYGVVSYTVAERWSEMAIRMAVGAQRADVRRLVLTEATGLALAGTALGIISAVALTDQLEALLFETSPLAPTVYLAVSTLLVATCLLATWMPARRATRVDPMAALRVE